MKLGFKPAGYRLVVRPDNIEEISAGGIYLNVDEKLENAAQTKGTLVAIGDQAWKDVVDGELWANVGDRIMYARYAGKNIEDPLTGERYIVLNDQDVIAVILKEKNDE